ncbi:MAG: KdsC family phosphatase [Muribaculaceae bacterium]
MSSIDYNLSKIRAFVFDIDGVLSPSVIPMASSGEPLRMLNIKDGYALQLAVKHGYKIAILTGANTKAVEVRYRGLGITDVFMSAAVKLPVLQQWMHDNNLESEQVVYCGDDIPDLHCMREVGLPVAPADAAAEVIEVAKYVTRCNGGYGVARDVIEQVMKAQGLWLDEKYAFGW